MGSAKTELLLAMEMLRARSATAEADVKIRATPKLGVFALSPLKAKTVFPVVSGLCTWARRIR